MSVLAGPAEDQLSVELIEMQVVHHVLLESQLFVYLVQQRQNVTGVYLSDLRLSIDPLGQVSQSIEEGLPRQVVGLAHEVPAGIECQLVIDVSSLGQTEQVVDDLGPIHVTDHLELLAVQEIDESPPVGRVVVDAVVTDLLYVQQVPRVFGWDIDALLLVGKPEFRACVLEVELALARVRYRSPINLALRRRVGGRGEESFLIIV